MTLSGILQTLLNKGVDISHPHAVDIGTEVSPDRISGKGVTLYPGTKIYGAETVISSGVKLGYEGPVTLEDCQLGKNCELKAGFFRSSVFLDGSSMGSGAHVREGCLLEEEANAGHTVGLKQTVLFPFVTLGSLINFCDCLMAGGTDRKNHSEVGSSYVHFNYTPQQDKATASLIGDVPRGVMLRQRPIFLGGQGGLVGPSRIGYGTVIAAGAVFRGDCPEGGKLISGPDTKTSENKDFHPGLYGDITRRVVNNVIYLANLLALKQWYVHVRRPFMTGDVHGEALYRGSLQILDMTAAERLKRLDDLADKMDGSTAQAARHLKGQSKTRIIEAQRAFEKRWLGMRQAFAMDPEDYPGVYERQRFLDGFGRAAGRNSQYLPTVKALPPETTATGECWLQQIVDGITNRAMAILRAEAK
ncbi:MAG: UDP-N-acetylglucosamine pyrophosphorylase [Syntrophaceae bacterium]|nr:UDP-N-acetylglucosamine pyrophosphorylase [Syntrophaceae bacterium]